MLDRSAKCTTDGAGAQDCPGYFGHIELAKPMFHIGFVKTVVKVLRCVSYHTSKLLVSKVVCGGYTTMMLAQPCDVDGAAMYLPTLQRHRTRTSEITTMHDHASPHTPIFVAQDDPKYKAAMRARNPEQRLRAFLAICSSKRTDIDGGNPQPAYRSEGLKITAEFVQRKNEEYEEHHDGMLCACCLLGGGASRRLFVLVVVRTVCCLLDNGGCRG